MNLPSPALHAQVACQWEATARKLGNVNRVTDFKNTSLTDFLISAAAIRDPLEQPAKSIGETIWNCVAATNQLVCQNTNLGMILLLAPLVHASGPGDLSTNLNQQLDELTVGDAIWVYRAIRLANPGGLRTSSTQDVNENPTVTLREAMRLAEERDLIARQYGNGFQDVFEFGVPRLVDSFSEHLSLEAAIIDCQLHWMARFPDSLIARKNGIHAAEQVRERVLNILENGGLASAEGRAACLELDRDLRQDGHRLNPGTTADLITACLYVALRQNKLTTSDRFPWTVTNWL